MILLVAAAAVLIPFIPLLLWSVSARWFYPLPWPQDLGLRAWTYVFGIAGFQIVSALWQSTVVALVTALLSIIIGLPAGRALGLYAFPGKDMVSILFIIPVIVPPLATAMGLHLWFLRLGLADTFAGVVLFHLTFCLPYAVFVMRGVFANYNPEFEDQARSLGAAPMRVFLSITLPMTLPGMAVAALFAFLLSWSQYLGTLIIGGGRITTLPILLFSLMASGDRPVASAVSLVFVLPALAALFVSAKYVGEKSMAGVW
jgi:putative spermidine/putrescine transport system permease protein